MARLRIGSRPFRLNPNPVKYDLFRLTKKFTTDLQRADLVFGGRAVWGAGDGGCGGRGEAGLCGAVWDLCGSVGADVFYSFESAASLWGEEVSGGVQGLRD